MPHGAATVGPLWSRQIPAQAYRVYASPSLDSEVDQPSGASKLCLSCHDGTLASVTAGGGAGGVVTGSSPWRAGHYAQASESGPVLGTDLSNDHPISFVYDASLAARDGQLAVPERAPTPLGGTITSDLLDPERRLQCTACHDVHDNSRGHFLRLSGERGALCTTCHQRQGYLDSAHHPEGARSPKGATLLEGGCATCHAPHGGARSAQLLIKPQTRLCGDCHASEARAMRSGSQSAHRLADDGARALGALSCSTCHDPHQVRASSLHERRLLTDPDAPVRPPRLLPEDEVPHRYGDAPLRAAEDSGAFCLDCHDGSWSGAVDIRAELASSFILRSQFSVGRANLHFTHAAAERPGEGAVGCTYCHDAHGSSGNRGVPRGKLLYSWLDVRDFPYRGESSCSTTDSALRCHTRR